MKSPEFVPKIASRCQGSDPKFSIHHWKFKNLVTIPCSDLDNIIEFVVVPFIQEESEDENPSGYEIEKHGRHEEMSDVNIVEHYRDDSTETATEQESLIYGDEL